MSEPTTMENACPLCAEVWNPTIWAACANVGISHNQHTQDVYDGYLERKHVRDGHERRMQEWVNTSSAPKSKRSEEPEPSAEP